MDREGSSVSRNRHLVKATHENSPVMSTNKRQGNSRRAVDDEQSDLCNSNREAYSYICNDDEDHNIERTEDDDIFDAVLLSKCLFSGKDQGNNNEQLLVKDEDVLCGRGKGYAAHEGNVRFREAVADCLVEYETSNRRDGKSLIAQSIVDLVNEWGGRFLRRDDERHEWYEISPKDKREKVSHAIRDALNKGKTKQGSKKSNEKSAKKRNSESKATVRPKLRNIPKKLFSKVKKSLLSRKKDTLHGFIRDVSPSSCESKDTPPTQPPCKNDGNVTPSSCESKDIPPVLPPCNNDDDVTPSFESKKVLPPVQPTCNNDADQQVMDYASMNMQPWPSGDNNYIITELAAFEANILEQDHKFDQGEFNYESSIQQEIVQASEVEEVSNDVLAFEPNEIEQYYKVEQIQSNETTIEESFVQASEVEGITNEGLAFEAFELDQYYKVEQIENNETAIEEDFVQATEVEEVSNEPNLTRCDSSSALSLALSGMLLDDENEFSDEKECFQNSFESLDWVTALEEDSSEKTSTTLAQDAAVLQGHIDNAAHDQLGLLPVALPVLGYKNVAVPESVAAMEMSSASIASYDSSDDQDDDEDTFQAPGVVKKPNEFPYKTPQE